MRLKVNRARKAVPFTIGAPIGGLNGRDGLADMPATDAFVMDNWFPASTTVDSRGGCLDFVTGISQPVESLEVYAGGATSKMLAFAGGSIYDVSIAGSVGAALATGYASSKVSTCMFSNAGAQFLICMTGADTPFSYDGATVSPLTITGLTGSDITLQNCFSFKGRLYLVQQNQLGFYYLGVGAIQGAASYFDLSQVCRRGGRLLGIASFSADSGSGPADYIVFMTSEGEYVVYTGTDPANAATWSLAGRYYSAAPIGRKGWFNFRSDLYIICKEGVIAFSEIRDNGELGKTKEYLTSKLGPLIGNYAVNESTWGWQGVGYARSSQLVINVPTASTETDNYVQFVMNTDTDAWCRFTGWNALTFTVFNGRLYYGTYAGAVVLADEGHTDNDSEIVCDCRQAYNYFDDGKGMGSADKHFHFATFVIQAGGSPSIASALNVNFIDAAPVLVTAPVAAIGALWDVTDWDTSLWGDAGVTQNLTVPYGELGYTASIWLRASTLGSSLKWFATRLVMEKTAGLVLI